MTPLSTRKMTRRQVLAVSAAAIPAASMLAAAALRSRAAIRPTEVRQAAYRFFDATEANFIEAACERLIPADSAGPGAREARVPEYLDRQLAGAWGRGELLYRLGQWQPGSPSERRQPSRPAELFRAALSAIHQDLSARGASFAALPTAAQDAYLAGLEAGSVLPGVATAAFFDLLLLMTTEGFFELSFGGGRRDRLAWPLRAFPGAYASAGAFEGRSRHQEAIGDIPQPALHGPDFRRRRPP
jgi:gluconate 2-dehydrogenase gamma chain